MKRIIKSCLALVVGVWCCLGTAGVALAEGSLTGDICSMKNLTAEQKAAAGCDDDEKIEDEEKTMIGLILVLKKYLHTILM